MHVNVKSIRFLHVLSQRAESRLILGMIACIFLLSSCSGVGKVEIDPSIAEGVAENLSFSGILAIVNAQDSAEERDLNFRGITVDYHGFTQSIVDALKVEFESNGATVQEQAEKTLYVTVTDVSMKPGPATFRGAINATVKTADGHTEEFYATRASYASGWNVGTNPTKPLNAAFKDLIKSIAENQAIREYLAN